MHAVIARAIHEERKALVRSTVHPSTWYACLLGETRRDDVDLQEPATKIQRSPSTTSEKSARRANLEAGDVPIDAITKLRVEEADHDIKFRTLSWPKATLLLFGEYVCLAILALAWSWSVLGWVLGFFVTFGMAIITWYTSYVLWQWCMLHPEARDICEIAATLFVSSGQSRLAWLMR